MILELLCVVAWGCKGSGRSESVEMGTKNGRTEVEFPIEWAGERNKKKISTAHQSLSRLGCVISPPKRPLCKRGAA